MLKNFSVDRTEHANLQKAEFVKASGGFQLVENRWINRKSILALSEGQLNTGQGGRVKLLLGVLPE